MILSVLTSTASMAQGGKAQTEKKAFNRKTEVAINIKASKEIIWSLLTNASDYPRWNSTIISLEGEIQKGKKIRLKSVLDEKRTFKLKVKEMIENQRMVWGDGKGNRVYELASNEDGSTKFFMSEKIGGLMFPMYAKYIPPFDDVFEQFARDLKQEAEKIANTTD